MRRALAFFVAMLLAVALALAQQNGPPPPPPDEVPLQGTRGAVIRSTSTLVLIDAQVIDKSGKPVTELTQGDFTLDEDGKEQRIAHLDYRDIEKLETAAAEDVQPVVVSLAGAAVPRSSRTASATAASSCCFST